MSKIEGGGRPNWWEWLVLAGVVAGAVLIAAAPIAGGVLAAGILPGIAGLRTDVPVPPLIALLLGVIVVAITIDGPLDRALARFTRPLPQIVTKAAQEGAGLALLAALIRPVMADWPSAIVAALIAALLYLVTSPVVEAWGRRRERDEG